MEMFLPAILSDLLGRSVSFVVQRYLQQGSTEDSVQQLHLALLRVSVTVEEAEGRRITNQAMLRQLDVLREAMYGGHYMLDALTCGRGHVADDAPAPCRLSSVLSRLNPAKRLCFGAADSAAEVRRVVDRLGCMIADMKEFVIFLKGYPRVCRQPYSAHLLLERFMFGRQKEMEQIVSFLLRQGEAGGGVGVLPVVGPARIGKSTLVEHVCHDDRVRNHFSSILLMTGDDLEDEKLNDPGDHGLIKHHDRASHPHKASLVIVELAEDEVPDEGRWSRLRSSAFCKGTGSRIIVTSRSEAAQRLGTERALRLSAEPRGLLVLLQDAGLRRRQPRGPPKAGRHRHGHMRGGEWVVHRRQHRLQPAEGQPGRPVLVQHPPEHEGVHGETPPPVRQAPARPPAEEPARVPVEAGPDVQGLRVLRLLPGVPGADGRPQDDAAGGSVRAAGALWEVRGPGVEVQIPPCYSYLMSCSVQTPVPHVLARKKSSRLV